MKSEEENDTPQIKKLKAEIKFWNDAWHEQRRATGKAWWDAYYQGVNDALNNKVYSPK